MIEYMLGDFRRDTADFPDGTTLRISDEGENKGVLLKGDGGQHQSGVYTMQLLGKCIYVPWISR